MERAGTIHRPESEGNQMRELQQGQGERVLIGDLPEGAAQVAADWHGGQTTALYALASTGDYLTGTVRPSYPDGYTNGIQGWRRATDAEWKNDLADSLAHEAREAYAAAVFEGEQAQRNGEHEEAAEVFRHALILRELADLAGAAAEHWGTIVDMEGDAK